MGDPTWQFRLSTTWDLDDYSINWTSRFIDRSVTYDITPESAGDTDGPEDLNPSWVPTIITHDLSFNYSLNENIDISGGIRNITDKVPPGYSFNALYDLVGRRAFLGMKVAF